MPLVASIAEFVARVRLAWAAAMRRPVGPACAMVLPDPAAGLVDGLGHAQVVLDDAEPADVPLDPGGRLPMLL